MSLPMWHGIALGWPVAPGQVGGTIIPAPVGILALLAASPPSGGNAIITDADGNPLTGADGVVTLAA